MVIGKEFYGAQVTLQPPEEALLWIFWGTTLQIKEFQIYPRPEGRGFLGAPGRAR
jgi:hypothetical protein